MMKTPFFKITIPILSPCFRACGFSFFAIATAFALLPQAAQAANITWDGGGVNGTVWNTATNWSGDVLPGAADTALFTNTGLPASTVISLGASQTIREFRINSYSNAPAFTVGSAADNTAGYTLTLTNVYRGDNVGNTQTIAAKVNLAADSTWNIINGYNGSVSVTGAIGSGSAVNFIKEGSNTLTLSGANTFTGGIRSVGGSLVLTNTNAYTGITAATGGNVTLSFGAATATDIINSASTLELGGIRGGGSLTVNGRNLANVINSQTFNGLTLKGSGTLSIVNGIASGKTLVALGAITRNIGSSVNVVQPTVNTTISAQNGYTTSTTNDSGGILGGWATVGAVDWATNNGTNIVAYTSYTADAWAAGNNTNVTTSGTIADDSTTHSLRFNAAAANTLTLGGTNTLTSGGILVTANVGNNLTTITGGTLVGSNGGDLVINQYNTFNSLTIASNIADNTTATALTKSGGGNLNLTGTLGYTGGTYVNAGTLTLVAASTNPLQNTGAITVAGGTLNLGVGTSQTTTGAVVLSNGTISNGTLINNGAALDARNGTISTKLAGSAGINKTTSGTLTLSNTAVNTFTGDTLITEGSVIGGAGGDVVSVNGNLIVGSASGGNAASYSNSGSNRGFKSDKNVTVYSNGSVNFGTGAQNLSGTINIIGGSVNAGSQLYNQNATWNLTGGSLSGNIYVNVGTYNTLASSATSTISILTSIASQTLTFNVADGAASTDLAFTGTFGGTSSNLAKNGAGTMVASGSSAYTGITTVNGGTLSVNTLANGGSNSAIGAAAAAATNLRLGNGTTFQYTGTGHSTDRLFTINGTTAGDSATLDASGTGAVNFTNTGAIAYGTTNQTRTLILAGTSTADNTLAAAIGNNGTGVVSVTKNDAGKWILSGTNTYTGATTINAGTLILNGSSTSATTIGATATLSGTGTISAATTILGTHSPGNSPGIQTFGSDLTYSGGASVVNWELKTNTVTNAANPNALFDTIIVGGNLDFQGATAMNLSFVPSGSTVLWSDTFWNTSRTGTSGWLVYDVAGTTSNFSNLTLNTINWTDSGSNAFNTALPGASFSFYKDGNDIYLNYTAVPEPATWGLLAFSLTTVLVLRRRKA